MFGVTTLEGDDDAELLEDIFTGVEDPDICVGDFEDVDALAENPAAKFWDERQDAHCQPELISLSLITGLWQS